MRYQVSQRLFNLTDTADFTPSDTQTAVFPSDSNVGDMQCVTFQIVGDDFKEIDETLSIIVDPEKGDDEISNPSRQISVIIEDDGDCKFQNLDYNRNTLRLCNTLPTIHLCLFKIVRSPPTDEAMLRAMNTFSDYPI